MASLVALGSGGVLLLLGLGLMNHGFKLRKQRNLVRETPTEPVGSVSMGQSAVRGDAYPADEGSIRTPFTDEECLVAVWEVATFREGADRDDPPKWATTGAGVDAVPFLVDDGTGQALVRPSDDAEYVLDTAAEDPIFVDADETPPAPIDEFLERDGWKGRTVERHADFPDTDGYEEGDRAYFQHLIRPGEETYVFGVAQPRDDVRSADNAANVVFESVPDEDSDLEDMFMIGDQSEDAIVENRGGTLWWFVVGAVVATVGFGLGLFGLGIF